MTYEEAVAQIMSIPKFSNEDTFSNTRELIRRIGNPQDHMKVIHIAGTNGKGSVSAFTSNMLCAGGYRVGLFTSPHLVRINERFQINNIPVSDEKMVQALEEVLKISQEMLKDGWVSPTFFDVLFAMAMVIFREEKVDYAVLETGLGGRRDATNVVEHPFACIITSISLDHTEILGDTITKIAGEKAGIIKKNVPLIYDGRCEEAESVLTCQAKKMNSSVSSLKEDMIKIQKTDDSSIDFQLNLPYYDGCIITVPYVAPYQVINASLALLSMEVIDPEHEIDRDARLKAIKHTRWQGRMETVLPQVIVDGAHNADGVKEFVRTLRQVREDGRRIVLLFSAVVEKDYQQMVKTICETKCFDEVVVTEIKGSRIINSDILASVFERYTDVPVSSIPDVREAFAEALKKKQEGLLFCVGSLYLVGEVKRVIEENDHD